MSEEYLIPIEDYLSAGIHIGTQQRTAHMQEYIYRMRTDGLHALDIKKTDSKLRSATKFIANYDPQDILIVSARVYGHLPVRKFAKIIGAEYYNGRFVPGTLTNPLYPKFMEPKLLIICDPRADSQALSEATRVGIPVVALVDTDNMINNVDLAVPTNNKGRKALSLVFWLLTREYLKLRGIISSDKEFTHKKEDFGMKVSS